MRILLVGPTHPHGGGIVHYTHSLANALAALPGVQVTLLSYTELFPRLLYRGPSAQSSQAMPLDPRVQVRKVLHYGNPLAWRAAARLVAGADAVHLQVWTPFLSPSMEPLLRAARRRGARTVATLHNVQPHDRAHRLVNPMTRRLLRHADRVLVHSDRLVAACTERLGVPADAVRVVPHGVYEGFMSGRWTRASARKELGYADGDLVVLAFGAIRPYKGLQFAIDALARLPAEFKLLVAGKAWGDWQEYQARIDAHGLGPRVKAVVAFIPDDEVERYMRAADVAVMPYVEFEAQSGAASAAVGAGVPVIVSRVGSLPDLTQPEWVVPPGDAAALAAKLEEFAAADPRPRAPDLSEAAWPAVARRTLAIYEGA